MKVNPNNTASVATTGTAGSAGAHGVVNRGSDARGTHAEGLGQDKLELSGLASNLAHAEAAGVAARANYVNQIARLYQAGQYEVDSGALARTLVQEALSGESVSGTGS